MKGYIVYKVFRKLKQSKVLYSFIILQLLVGFYILSLFITTTVSYQTTYNTMLNSGLDRKYYLNFSLRNKELYDEDKFDIMTWGKMKPVINEYENSLFNNNTLVELEQLTGAQVRAEVNIPLYYLKGEEGQKNTIYYKSGINKVYISKKFLSIIDNITTDTTVNPRDFPYQYVNKKLLNKLDSSTKTVEIIDDEKSYICIPMEWYYPIFHYKNINNTNLIVSFPKSYKLSAIELMKKMNEIKQFFEEKNTDYTISIDNEFYDFVQQANDMKDSCVIFNLIGITLLVIIMMGMLGMFMLFMEQRKHEIAICIALGATKIQIASEILIEIMVITYIGYGLAIIGSALTLINGFENATVIVYYNPEISLILAVLPFIIGIMASIPSVYMIKRLLPLEILRSL